MSFITNKLLFVETASYHDSHARPYVTDIQDGSVVSRLREYTQDGLNMSAQSVAGVASQIIKPSTEAGRIINIQNGWNERRMRFLMEIEAVVAGMTVRKIILGYTDYVGANESGACDPNLKLFINNVIVLRQVGMQWVVHESNHVLVNDLLVHAGGLGLQGNQNVIMRPEDVFGSLQANYMYQSDDITVTDFRHRFNLGVMKSNRQNTNHNEYLAKTLGALNNAQNNGNLAEESYDHIVNEARSKVRESSVHDDQILSQWDDQTGYIEQGFITYGMLADISPSVLHNTRVFLSKPAERSATTYTDNTEHFRGSTVETIMASILSNTIPPLAMECLLTKVEFQMTNATINGQPDCRWLNVPRGFSDDLNLEPLKMAFMDRLANLVLRDVTNNGNFVVTIRVRCDLLGETVLGIAVNGQPEVPYVIPTFADGLIAPVVGNNEGDISSMAADMDALSNTFGLNTGTGGVMPPMGGFGGNTPGAI